MSGRLDAIVVGLGASGSAALWQLARRGRRALGLERFDIPHERGSYHGLTRIIRLAYYEHPGYVPLLVRAFELWRETQQAWGQQLLWVTGSIDAGPEGSAVFEGSLASCRLHGLEHEVLDTDALAARFPAYRLPAGHRALFQPAGGFLASERVVVAQVELAQAAGAIARAREPVLDWQPLADGGVRVWTARASYEAERLILTAGAWIGGLVPALAGKAVPERQVLGWFQPADPAPFRPAAFPVFNLAVEEGRYYGLPVWGMPGFKLGRYHHLDEPVDPDRFDREPRPEDEAVLRACVRRYFPAADGPVMGLKACMFTNTPDEHFVVDRLPDHPQVVVASPCSGHGFKFASVMGEILADLALDGRTRHDIGLFRLERLTRAA
jgi:sarcosine oxidase